MKKEVELQKIEEKLRDEDIRLKNFDEHLKVREQDYLEKHKYLKQLMSEIGI